MKPLAIVTVTYSPGKHLPALVNSLPDATTRDVHLVLADNGSTDGSVEAAAAADTSDTNYTIHLHRTGGNIGYGSAINSAARYLRRLKDKGEIDAEYFLIVNPDVEFTAGSIDSLLDVADHNPQAGSVGPLIENTDGTIYPSARAIPTLTNGIGHALLGSVWKGNPFSRQYRQQNETVRQRRVGWLSGACLLMRWEAFDAVDGFDEAYFMYMEDVDLGDRLAHAGWDNVFAPQSHIIHDQGHSAKRHFSTMLPAHHASAYRFQADRHPGWRWLPVRLALRVGLSLRASIVVRLAHLVG